MRLLRRAPEWTIGKSGLVNVIFTANFRGQPFDLQVWCSVGVRLFTTDSGLDF